MSSGSGEDRDLLARLNALKKSTIDFDNTIGTPVADRSVPIDPAPARALHADLVDRFKTLSGTSRTTTGQFVAESNSNDHASLGADEFADEGKTVEELLADLGPVEQWEVDKSEQDQVDDLLRSANTALNSRPNLEKTPNEDDANAGESHPTSHTMPSIDLTAFHPEPESDNETTEKPHKEELRRSVNQEADDVLQRLLDEVDYEKKFGLAPDQESQDTDEEGDDRPRVEHVGTPDPRALPSSSSAPSNPDNSNPALDLPSTPADLPAPPPVTSTNEDSDLAARFASLALPTSTLLPSVPTTISSTAKSPPASSKPPAPGLTDEDIDTWCIICMDDANLRCLGCDGDLYCTNCWVEGHRGEDAGYEERRHKAVEFVKKGKKNKRAAGRVLVGA
ncbi:uncharacterized protein HMPREF1541_08089 [Cyphellophora europaea CBS 101466]|uniref:Abscission/NoCut checkpoint regulator n=1 Tax=Cyphellophora europaea (strain CBS 101466) TaxID=1220924 RepID=W2RMY6_CYPE1|nr:uncharacterized protein HMPREF1541_08089 [Cyphellophora europaea CBS 101466]ETN37099.1 hypothetical protein HMPREF1541_08089 [Cyphellophora europaea CBS 101466]